MLDLGTLAETSNSSVGYSVNTRGDVVGQSDVIQNDIVRSHAFLYTSESGMVDLNTLVDPLYFDPLLGWELQVAWAINDFGQIVVGGYFREGGHAFLLTPVPEPEAALLLMLAVLGLFVSFAQRRRVGSFVFRGPVAVSIVLFAFTGRASAAMYSAANVPELIADINAANQTPESDSIALVAGSTYTLMDLDNSLNGSSGLPIIGAGEDLTIVGNGATIERSTAADTFEFRFFHVAVDASLSLENVTLQHGRAVGSGAFAQGGAIFNLGTLTLRNVMLRLCRGHGDAGACVQHRSGHVYALSHAEHRQF
jgi:probable HAF family extracellular repeat protein